MKYDISILNAKTRGEDYNVDLHIKNGMICKIQRHRVNNEFKSDKVIDANGRVLSTAFVEPHIHLDKVRVKSYTKENITGTLNEAIEILWDYKKRYTVKEIIKRASPVIEKAIINGSLFMRSHADVDTIGKLIPIEAVNELREIYKDLIEIQSVVFPQEGIIKDPGTKELMKKSMQMGANLVGGMPANENSYKDSVEHVRFCFELASEYGASIDMHVDESDDPNVRTLEIVADYTKKYNYENKVTCAHTCSLAAYDDDYANFVMDKVRDAKINMITNPCTNLVLQGRNDKMPIRRGLTRVKELLERKVIVSCAQDCVDDTFYPFGNANMLSVALIAAHAIQLTMPKEIEELYNMITKYPAKILELKDYGIKENYPANLVLLDSYTIKEAISKTHPPIYVIRNGKIIVKNKMESELII